MLRDYPNRISIPTVVVLGPSSERKWQILDAIRESIGVLSSIKAPTLGGPSLGWITFLT